MAGAIEAKAGLLERDGVAARVRLSLEDATGNACASERLGRGQAR
jgi:hypothetical protein